MVSAKILKLTSHCVVLSRAFHFPVMVSLLVFLQNVQSFLKEGEAVRLTPDERVFVCSAIVTAEYIIGKTSNYIIAGNGRTRFMIELKLIEVCF